MSGPVNPIKPQTNKKGGNRKRSASKEAPSSMIDLSKVQNSYVVVGPGEAKKKQVPKVPSKDKEENKEESNTNASTEKNTADKK